MSSGLLLDWSMSKQTYIYLVWVHLLAFSSCKDDIIVPCMEDINIQDEMSLLTMIVWCGISNKVKMT